MLNLLKFNGLNEYFDFIKSIDEFARHYSLKLLY